jgi:hypothetical protein
MPPVIGYGPGRCPPAGRVPLHPSGERGVTPAAGPGRDWTGSAADILIANPPAMMRADVQKDEAAARLARQASDALAELLEHVRERPATGDRFDACSDSLDELARAVMAIGEIVDGYTARSRAEEDPDGVAARARELATAIVRRRNSLLAENAAVRLRRAGPVPVRRAG